MNSSMFSSGLSGRRDTQTCRKVSACLPRSVILSIPRNRSQSEGTALIQKYGQPALLVRSETGNVSALALTLSRELRAASNSDKSVVTGSQPAISNTSQRGSQAHKRNNSGTQASSYGDRSERPSRLKGRDDAIIKWSDLLEKFRSVQERARKASNKSTVHQLDDNPRLVELRITEDLVPIKPTPEPAVRRTQGAPVVPPKDPKDRTKSVGSNFGRQFGRLAGVRARKGGN